MIMMIRYVMYNVYRLLFHEDKIIKYVDRIIQVAMKKIYTCIQNYGHHGIVMPYADRNLGKHWLR